MPYQRGSGFVGLQQYLGANQQAGQQLGNQLATQVEQQGMAAQGAIDAQRAAMEKQIAEGTPGFNTYGLEPDEVAAMRERVQQGYTGPTSMSNSNADTLSRQAIDAQSLARMGGSDAGRAVLLQRGQQTAAPYNLGARSLDAALAGRGGGQRLAQAASRFGELQKYLGTAQQGVADSVKAAQERTRATQAQVAATPLPSYGPAQPKPGRDPYEEANRRGRTGSPYGGGR
jgi:hypothetical protein